MVNGIGSYNHMNYMQTRMPRSGPDPSEMFSNVDSDGSGGISQSELETFVQDISDKTGNSIDTTDAVSTYDADGDGELSSNELKSIMEASVVPPEDMMDSVGSTGRTSSTSAESVVSEYDTDGDGMVSSDELQGYLDNTDKTFIKAMMPQGHVCLCDEFREQPVLPSGERPL